MPLLPASELAKLSPVFRGKAGGLFAEIVRKVLSLDDLSDLYDRHLDMEGADFAEALIKDVNPNISLGGADRLLRLPGGPFITVSNHPYGGVDGVILVDLIGHMREDFKVMVNDLLSLIEPLRSSWIVVNPKNDLQNEVTSKNIQGVKRVMQTLSEGHPVGFFPSGAISDLKVKERRIRDREWQLPVLRLIQKAKVPIVPVRFFDHNSMWFYLLGLLDWKIRLLQLPREVFNKKKKMIRVGIGETITVEEQQEHREITEFGSWLRDRVYGMPIPDSLEPYRDFVSRTRD